MKYRIITTEPNCKTARYFDRVGIPYKLVACECQKEAFKGTDAIFYKCRGVHGSNIARKMALLEDGCAVFDDDYNNLQFGGVASTTLKSGSWTDAEKIDRCLETMAEIEKKNEKLIIGGYSGGAKAGADDRIKSNIMQVFISGKINRFFREDSELYRLNDDVCACIMAKRRGFYTMGLWSIMRANQTPEQQDNTNKYDSRSWAKSYFPVLYAPTAAKVVWCPEKRLSKGKTRPGRFHHIITWRKISPKLVEAR